jgi:hypothetical protein
MALKMPAVAGQVHVKGDDNGVVLETKTKMYWSATMTCMYMMQWSHPDISNAVHGLTRHMALIKYVIRQIESQVQGQDPWEIRLRLCYEFQ